MMRGTLSGASALGGTLTTGGRVYPTYEVASLQAITGVTPFVMTEYGTIRTNYGEGTVLPMTVTSSTTYCHKVLECKAGDVFTINGTGAGNGRLWAFVTDEYVSLHVYAESNATAVNERLVAPEGAGYLIVNATYGSVCYIGDIGIDRRVTELQNIAAGNVGTPIANNVGSDFVWDGEFVEPYVTGKTAAIYAIWDSLMADHSDYITREVLGQDESGTYDIRHYTVNPHLESAPVGTPTPLGNIGKIGPSYPKPLKVIVVAGIHGTEAQALFASTLFFKHLLENRYTDDNMRLLWDNCTFEVIPVMNPWGQDNGTRYNSNGVNLNRNFAADWTYTTTQYDASGSAPESEAETKAVCDFLRDNTDAFLTIFPHNEDDLTTGSNFAYIRSNFVTDRNVFLAIARKCDSLLKRRIPQIADLYPQNMLQFHNTFNSGVADTWYNYALGMHGFELEVAPAFGSNFSFTTTEVHQKIQAATIDLIGSLLVGFVQHNQTVLADDTQISKHTIS